MKNVKSSLSATSVGRAAIIVSKLSKDAVVVPTICAASNSEPADPLDNNLNRPLVSQVPPNAEAEPETCCHKN